MFEDRFDALDFQLVFFRLELIFERFCPIIVAAGIFGFRSRFVSANFFVLRTFFPIIRIDRLDDDMMIPGGGGARRLLLAEVVPKPVVSAGEGEREIRSRRNVEHRALLFFFPIADFFITSREERHTTKAPNDDDT